MEPEGSSRRFVLRNCGHRFQNRWVFRGLSGQIESKSHLLIRGANGSGKSTLARILAGTLTPAEGIVGWTQTLDAVAVDPPSPLETLLIGPGMALHPDLTLKETIAFHEAFRPFWPDLHPWVALEQTGLTAHLEKPLRSFSSGMRQRVKLALGLCTQSNLIVLDEPSANLDAAGIRWYQELLQSTMGRTATLVCSNHRPEDHLTPDEIWDL
jgi:ABC-type multidrug transport system ATPase subunit